MMEEADSLFRSLMPIDFRNLNTVWSSILVETLCRLGLTTAVVCPGSRSAPLAIAFAQHPTIEAIPVLDERSAAFFALGLARQSGQPVALVCTSGTAGANFYPAVIEAYESRVPLLILTADRPPELRDCNAGQTVDQQKLYGSFPNWYHEVATPSPTAAMLAYLRQTVVQAWERSRYPVAGVVHLNLPFRDPLAPLPQPDVQSLAQSLDEAAFFAGVGIAGQAMPAPMFYPSLEVLDHWRQTMRGIIIAGIDQVQSPQPYCEAIAQLSQTLGFPVLAEGLSPLRNYADCNPNLISTYDLLLRDAKLAAELAPEVVIRIGEMPTSKELRSWLERSQPYQWVVDGGDRAPAGAYRNFDPVHLRTVHLHLPVTSLAAMLPPDPAPTTPYLKRWSELESQVRQTMDRSLSELQELREGKVAWLMSHCLPAETPVFIANSMSVRYVEWFWQPGNRRIQPFFNRGANGIDGTLSTALGIAHRNRSSLLLTGDLALLHDTNGLLLHQILQGHLTIVLINNNGGGIFEMLPIAQFNPPFEAFFATPQQVDLAKLCSAYGITYERIQSWDQLTQRLTLLPETGIRVLEVPCDRQLDARWLRDNWSQWSTTTH